MQQNCFECLMMLIDVIHKGLVPYSGSNNNFMEVSGVPRELLYMLIWRSSRQCVESDHRKARYMYGEASKEALRPEQRSPATAGRWACPCRLKNTQNPTLSDKVGFCVFWVYTEMLMACYGIFTYSSSMRSCMWPSPGYLGTRSNERLWISIINICMMHVFHTTGTFPDMQLFQSAHILSWRIDRVQWFRI